MVVGVSDIRSFTGTQSHIYLEMYVSAIRFLTSPQAQSVGIERIAYNTGSSATGENFPDQPGNVGHNAWSCFRFLSASVPFYMLIQATGNNSPNSAPGTPGLFDNNAGVSGLAVSFAMRADGGNPWNGSVARSGSDWKGTPVWTGGSSDLFVWPRVNGIGGSRASNKDSMMGIFRSVAISAPFPRAGTRMSIVSDENNIIFVGDDDSDMNCRLLYFGKYVPRPGLTTGHPYVCLRNSEDTVASFTHTTYGSTSGNAVLIADGGIVHPTLLSSGTCAVIATSLSAFWSQTFQPNTVVPTGSFAFDEFPIFIGVSEYPHAGYVGMIDWIRQTYGPGTGETNESGTRAFFGNSSRWSAKVSIPWSPDVSPYTGTDRAGTIFVY